MLSADALLIVGSEERLQRTVKEMRMVCGRRKLKVDMYKSKIMNSIR